MKLNTNSMKTRLVRVFLSICTAVLILPSVLFPLAAEESDIIKLKLKQAGAGSVQQWIDSELTERAGSDAEWYVLSLCQSGNYNFSKYANALAAKLHSGKPSNIVERQRCALALLSTGYTSKAVKEICSVTGRSPENASVMQLIFGLHLSNITGDTVGQAAIITELINKRIIAGSGWAITSSSPQPDTDVTAMALSALAPHYSAPEVKSAVDRALDLLSSAQLSNGGFKSYGVENSESCSQVIIALTALKIDPENDARFCKSDGNPVSALLKFQASNGEFKHKADGSANQIATVQALCALTARSLYRFGSGSFYKTTAGALREIAITAPAVAPEGFSSSESSSENSSQGSVTNQSQPGSSSSSATASSAADEAVSAPGDESSLPSESSNASEYNKSDDGENKSDTAEGHKSGIKIKYIIAAVLAALGITAAAVLYIKKRGTAKNYILISAVTLFCIAAALLLNIESPSQYYSTENSSLKVTVTVSCEQLIGKSDNIPENGYIIKEESVTINQDDTVLDALNRAAKEFNLSISQSGSGATAYIQAINGIREMQFGELSGWIYTVDGKSPDISSGAYSLSGGEKIVWFYTTDGILDS